MARKLWALFACTAVIACAPVARFKDPALGSSEMVWVRGGCFEMGSPFGTPGGPEEKPPHEVCVDGFYIGNTEVTQGLWTQVMGTNPSINAACGPDCPVENVSWDDAQDFVAKVNARAAAAGGAPPGRYRLPTEAEWEYAARSGGKSETYSGRSNDVSAVGWYAWNSFGIHPVARKAPNGLGLHDMTGNVWEWTGDWYSSTYYADSPRENPTGPPSGERRVLRGGSYASDNFDLRTTYRNFLPPDHRSGSRGLRLVRTNP